MNSRDIFDEIDESVSPNGDVFESIQEVAQEKQSPQIAKSPFEEFIGDTPRHLTRTASRVGETILGLPGEMRDFFSWMGSSLGEMAGDAGRKLLGKEPLTDDQKSQLREMIDSGNFESVMKAFPTQQELQSYSESATRGFTQAQDPIEKFSDEVFKDFTSLAMPIGNKPGFLKTLGTAFLGNAGAKALESLGVSQGGQDALKLGTFLTLGMMGKGTAREYGNSMLNKAENAIKSKPGVLVDAQPLERKLLQLQNDMQKGIQTETKKAVLNLTDGALSKIQNGKMDPEEATQIVRDINEMIYSQGRDINRLERAKKLIPDIKNSIKTQLTDYGKKHNPEFLKYYKEGNQAIAGIEQSNRIANAISKYVNVGDLSPSVKFALGFSVLKNPATAGPIGATLMAAKSAQVMKRIATNPALRRYYTNLISSSLRDNKESIIRNINGLNREMQKEDSLFSEEVE